MSLERLLAFRNNSQISDIANKLPYKITVSETEPLNPQVGDLWFRIPPATPESPVTDYYLRFDASKLSLANDAKVSIWEDLSENGNDVTQVNATYQPVYKTTGLNGKPAVYFDGDTYLERTPFTLSNLDEVTVFAVYQLNSIASMTVMDIGTPNEIEADSTSVIIRASGSSEINQFKINDSVSAEFATTTDPVMVIGTYDKTNSILYKNGVQVDSEAYTSSINAHDVLRLGICNRTGYSQGMIGNLSELIVFSRKLTTAEISSMSEYGINKWLS